MIRQLLSAEDYRLIGNGVKKISIMRYHHNRLAFAFVKKVRLEP